MHHCELTARGRLEEVAVGLSNIPVLRVPGLVLNSRMIHILTISCVFQKLQQLFYLLLVGRNALFFFSCWFLLGKIFEQHPVVPLFLQHLEQLFVKAIFFIGIFLGSGVLLEHQRLRSLSVAVDVVCFFVLLFDYFSLKYQFLAQFSLDGIARAVPEELAIGKRVYLDHGLCELVDHVCLLA